MREQSVTCPREATFSALADPTRRAVLDLLRHGSLPAGRIAQAFPISRPAVSRHLRLLRRAHLVQERRAGRHLFYELNPGPLREVDTWVKRYQGFWQASLTGLQAVDEGGRKRKPAGHTTKKKIRPV